MVKVLRYIGGLETTIAGSRSSHRSSSGIACARWVATARRTWCSAASIAEDAVQKLNAHGIDAWWHENSVTRGLSLSPAAVIQKWIIAPKNGIGHLTVMPHVSTAIIDEFVAHPTTRSMAGRTISGYRKPAISHAGRARVRWHGTVSGTRQIASKTSRVASASPGNSPSGRVSSKGRLAYRASRQWRRGGNCRSGQRYFRSSNSSG